MLATRKPVTQNRVAIIKMNPFSKDTKSEIRFSFMTGILIVIFSCPIYGQDLPNLTSYQPTGWSDKIVVSSVKGTNIDSTVFETIDPLYVDRAVINNGDSTVTNPFKIRLLVDGEERATHSASIPLRPQAYTVKEDLLIGLLSAGSHTIKVVSDSTDAIAESNETDNEYSKTITVVSPSCYPLTVSVSPQGAGTITKDIAANCENTGVSLSSIVGHGSHFDQQAEWQGKATEHSPKVFKAQVFSTLMAKATSQGRVRVIVGLRTQGQWNNSVESFGDLDARSPTIFQVQTSLLSRMMDYNVSSIRTFDFIPYVAMEVDAACLEYLALDPRVKTIEEDILFRPLLAESATIVGAPASWDRGFSGDGQTVAILDTGVDKAHPFLEGKVVSEACYSSGKVSLCPGGVSESTDPGSAVPCSAGCLHGTHVAGTAAGKGTDFSGIAKKANIIAIQVFSRSCENCGLGAYNSDITAALERVVKLSPSFNIASVNMSLGSNAPSNMSCDAKRPAMKAAIDNLREIGIATIVSSGNGGSSTKIGIPACISTAVSVGSTDDGSCRNSSCTTQDSVSSFSNSSPLLDLLAPGKWITASVPHKGEFQTMSGTSMSAPHVTGAWAVLKSKVPNASVEQVLSSLTGTGKPIVDLRNGLSIPRIQVDAALDTLTLVDRYTLGTRVTLTANQNNGFQFKSWDGCESVSGNQCTVQVNSVKSVTAEFEPSLNGNPDLIPTAVQGPLTAIVGGKVSIGIDLSNGGLVNSGAFRVGTYLSSDETITSDDILIAVCDYDSGLQVNQSSSCNGPLFLPSSLTPGTYFLGVLVDDQGQVNESNEFNNTLLASSSSIRIAARSFVPIVLSLEGLNSSFFTSEVALTNRGNQNETITYKYAAQFGRGSGTGLDSLDAGKQKIIPDMITYLRSLGVPIADSGNRGGTLAVEFSDSSDVDVMVRTTTAVPEGRAGLAYPGIPSKAGLTETVYLCGLRQNEIDRSNVAIQNMGTSVDGFVVLNVTVFSGDKDNLTSKKLGSKALAPGAFHQFSGILAEGGFSNGFVKVERIGGGAPFYAYGVINDQANSDGSFVFPVAESSISGKTRQTLPVIVEVGAFDSELTVTNFSSLVKTIDFSFVADGIQTPDNTARFKLTLQAREQKIVANLVEFLRAQAIEGIGPRGPTFAGALFATVDSGDMSGIVIGARTGSPGGGGQYGTFYNAVPFGAASTDKTWVYGLQQNTENRSNLALVNTGEVDNSSSVFALDIYDGETGNLAKTINVTVDAKRWKQIDGILKNSTSTTQGYVGVRKLSGNNSFIAYGVINDGAEPGQRSGDGAYIPSQN